MTTRNGGSGDENGTVELSSVVIAGAVIVFELGGIVSVVFFLLSSQRVSSHSCETFTKGAT